VLGTRVTQEYSPPLLVFHIAPELWLKIFACMVHRFKPGTRPAFESFFRKFVGRTGPGSVVVFLRMGPRSALKGGSGK